jgi:ATP phosphoribosyltransferase
MVAIGLYQPIDLQALPAAGCASRRATGFDYAQAVRRGARLRIATKYIDRGARAFRSQGRACRSHQAVWLDGTWRRWSGLADVIVDLVVSTGSDAEAPTIWSRSRRSCRFRRGSW